MAGKYNAAKRLAEVTSAQNQRVDIRRQFSSALFYEDATASTLFGAQRMAGSTSAASSAGATHARQATDASASLVTANVIVSCTCEPDVRAVVR